MPVPLTITFPKNAVGALTLQHGGTRIPNNLFKYGHKKRLHGKMQASLCLHPLVYMNEHCKDADFI